MVQRVKDFFAENEGLLQFIKFCTVGASSAVIDAGLFFVLLKLHIAWMLARTCSFTIAVINGFIWNRRWTFKVHSRESSQSQFVKFFSINVIGLALNLAIMKFMYFIQLGHAPTAHEHDLRQTAIAFLVAITIVSVWNFLGSKFWSFKSAAPATNESAV